MTTMPALDSHLENFRRMDGNGPATVLALRERALTRFAELGFPTPALEDWKYTNVGPLAGQAFRLASDDIPGDAESLVAGARLGVGSELVFVNGRYAAGLSSPGPLPKGALVGSLADGLRTHPELIEPHLGRYATFDQSHQSLTALNTAFIRDGAFIYVPVGIALDAPVQCLVVSAGSDGGIVTHPRTLIVAGEGSRVTVIEHYVGHGAYWTNAVTEAIIEAGASVVYHTLQREAEQASHLGVVAVEQAADSTFRSHAVSLGAGLARTDIATRLDGPGAACTFDGLYLARGTQHVDHHTTIDHRQPRGTSRELYKGILDGRATGVFNGKVFVRPHAQQSDAQQMNKNLLLSDDAQIDTKPQLEILADDVKCSHGATIGQLDDEAVFYLRTRGIDAAAARIMLVFAFANEVISTISVAPLRDMLGTILAERLLNGAEVGP
jgi:Fe-S cluster assembly protein SufD